MYKNNVVYHEMIGIGKKWVPNLATWHTQVHEQCGASRRLAGAPVARCRPVGFNGVGKWVILVGATRPKKWPLCGLVNDEDVHRISIAEFRLDRKI